MDVTPLVRQGQQIIQSYADGRFKISGQVYDSAVIVYPGGTEFWPIQKSFNDLSEDDFNTLAAHANDLDVVLIGTGPDMEFMSPAFKARLKEKGLIAEQMDTGAACRTYNVLMAEGRRVAAALLPF